MSLLNISFKLHTLAPCPRAPRNLPQSSSSPELCRGLPGVNIPGGASTCAARATPGAAGSPGPGGEADAASRPPRQRPWGGERRRRGSGSAVCLAPLSGTQTRRGSEVGGKAAGLRWSSSSGAVGQEGSSRGCRGGWEGAAAGKQRQPCVSGCCPRRVVRWREGTCASPSLAARSPAVGMGSSAGSRVPAGAARHGGKRVPGVVVAVDRTPCPSCLRKQQPRGTGEALRAGLAGQTDEGGGERGRAWRAARRGHGGG